MDNIKTNNAIKKDITVNTIVSTIVIVKNPIIISITKVYYI